MVMWHFNSCHINLGLHNIHVKNLNKNLLNVTCHYPKCTITIHGLLPEIIFCVGKLVVA